MFLVKCLQGKISSLKWDFKSVSYLLSLCRKAPLDEYPSAQRDFLTGNFAPSSSQITLL